MLLQQQQLILHPDLEFRTLDYKCRHRHTLTDRQTDIHTHTRPPTDVTWCDVNEWMAAELYRPYNVIQALCMKSYLPWHCSIIQAVTVNLHACQQLQCVSESVCLCVWERQRDRERDSACVCVCVFLWSNWTLMIACVYMVLSPMLTNLIAMFVEKTFSTCISNRSSLVFFMINGSKRISSRYVVPWGTLWQIVALPRPFVGGVFWMVLCKNPQTFIGRGFQPGTVNWRDHWTGTLCHLMCP